MPVDKWYVVFASCGSDKTKLTEKKHREIYTSFLIIRVFDESAIFGEFSSLYYDNAMLYQIPFECGNKCKVFYNAYGILF